MATRRRSREVALQLLFQLDASEVTTDHAIELYRKCFADGPLPDDFSLNLFRGVADSISRVDTIIESSSENWRLDRMSRVDRNILRLGAYELLAVDEVPMRVAINEAVELAKRFGTAESASFVNGILDRVAREFKEL